MNHMDDCFAGSPQEFLICVTVHKAANTGVSTGETYVKVSLDKISKNTKTFPNSENPFFNEYFVFEFHCTLPELLRLTILFELKKYALYKKNIVVGELLIDLHSVWSQSTHSYFKKWGRLDQPITESSASELGPRHNAYLQIDLAIISQYSRLKTGLSAPIEEPIAEQLEKWNTHHDFDDIKNNLLQDVDSYTQSNIRYYISLYRGMFLRKSNYMIQVSFAGIKGKTQVAKHTATPVWNHEISFAWVYPSLAQRFLILILLNDHLQWKCVAEFEIGFDEIAFKGQPALGPTYLHFYDPINPLNYVGRLLMELRSEVISHDHPSHVLISQPIAGLEDSRYWADENFLVEFLPILGDHIISSASHYKFTIKLAENTSNVLEGTLRSPVGKFHSLMHTKCFRQETPFRSCLLRARLADTRHKYESDFFLLELTNYMSTTVWDQNRQNYLLDYYAKLSQDLRALRHKIRKIYSEHLDATIADVLNELQQLVLELSSLTHSIRLQDDWPELCIMLSAAGKDIGVCRLNSKHFLNLPQKLKTHVNNQCWKVKSFLFKNINCGHTCANCGCNVGIVLGCISILAEHERKDFLSCIVGDWASPEPLLWLPNVVQTHFRFNVYVHQAKVRPGGERKNISDGHIRVLFAEQAAETYTAPATLSPIWNAVITFKGLVLPGSISWYLQNPPLISLEFYYTESMQAEDAGNGQTVVSVISGSHIAAESNWTEGSRIWGKSAVRTLDRLRHVTPPPLKWVPVAKKGLVQAEVLMSAEFIELVGVPDAQQTDKQPTLTTGIPLAIKPNMLNYVLEVIFVGMRNYTKSSLSLAGKRRAKVMMADLVLTSGLSTSRVRNSINFLVAYAAGVVSLPDQQEYWPAMIATDVLISNFTNESTLGAALIPNSSSFLNKDKLRKCLRSTATINESTVATSATALAESTYEETEDEDDVQPAYENGCWKRLKIVLGLRTAEFANKRQLKYHNLVECSDLNINSNFTWWTKFYNAMYEDEEHTADRCKHSLIIYPNELEKQAEFSFLQDWAVPVPLVHGVKFKKHGPPKEDIYATLKLQIKITPCVCDAADEGAGGDMQRPLATAMNPHQQNVMKSLAEAMTLLVRVYIVQGIHIRPRDWTTDSDCYVKLSLAGKTLSDRAHYIPNQSNPIFGRYFELEAALPADHMLEIWLYDQDDKGKDNLIGYTQIDLEDRWRSKHRATVGIPQSIRGGTNLCYIEPPSVLLTQLCQQQNIPPPYIYGNIIEVDGMIFADETVISKSEDLQERLSLTALKHLNKLPSFGYKLVPEHVETRSLYSDGYLGVVQGKLQLWLELYEASMFIPPPIDITPMPPIAYEVRVVVKNLSGIQFGDVNIFGKLMSDVYVIGWCQDAHKYQSTDIHYRSFAGQAAFNWRMIFELNYAPNEDMMVIRRKGGLHEEIEIKRPPIIYLQVWDKDMVTRDEHLAAIDLNLSNLPVPYSAAQLCPLLPSKRKRLNLFTRQSISGWFPLQAAPNPLHKEQHTNGKIELHLEICTETEAANMPAGLGRKPPMALEKPYRAETAFNPLTHPLKSCKHILWPAIRKYVLLGLLFLLFALGMVLFFANLPNKLMTIPLE
ncbi:otoferlin [Drosophila busckii]|uniref:otoferlin n=1 Tax=Drosophila busckii TaxID=30019 RepID=UPI0014329C8D|nr:otoferlin [Drosophila busckii]